MMETHEQEDTSFELLVVRSSTEDYHLCPPVILKVVMRIDEITKLCLLPSVCRSIAAVFKSDCQDLVRVISMGNHPRAIVQACLERYPVLRDIRIPKHAEFCNGNLSGPIELLRCCRAVQIDALSTWHKQNQLRCPFCSVRIGPASDDWTGILQCGWCRFEVISRWGRNMLVEGDLIAHQHSNGLIVVRVKQISRFRSSPSSHITFTGVSQRFEGEQFYDELRLEEESELLVPRVVETAYTVVDIDCDGYLSLLGPDGEMRSDLKLQAFTGQVIESLTGDPAALYRGGMSAVIDAVQAAIASVGLEAVVSRIESVAKLGSSPAIQDGLESQCKLEQMGFDQIEEVTRLRCFDSEATVSDSVSDSESVSDSDY